MEKYSLWLSPETELTQKIKSDIIRIAASYGGPIFDPHVTLAGEITSSKEQTIKLAETFADQMPAAPSRVVGIGFGHTYFQSFFLEIEFPRQLNNMRLSILNKLDLTVTYPPHISLAYGVSKREIGKREIESIQMNYCNTTVEFSSVDIVASSVDKAVEDWAYINRISLVG